MATSIAICLLVTYCLVTSTSRADLNITGLRSFELTENSITDGEVDEIGEGVPISWEPFVSTE